MGSAVRVKSGAANALLLFLAKLLFLAVLPLVLFFAAFIFFFKKRKEDDIGAPDAAEQKIEQVAGEEASENDDALRNLYTFDLRDYSPSNRLNQVHKKFSEDGATVQNKTPLEEWAAKRGVMRMERE